MFGTAGICRPFAFLAPRFTGVQQTLTFCEGYAFILVIDAKVRMRERSHLPERSLRPGSRNRQVGTVVDTADPIRVP
jgi:hypothetical protein